MEEKKRSLSQCKVGDILSRHVWNEGNGVVLCKKGRTLTEETLEWLKNFRHSDIYILEDRWNQIWNLNEEDIEVYEESTELVKDVLENFRFSDKVDYDTIHKIGERCFETFNEKNSAVMGCVNRMREVDAYTYTHSMNVGMLAVMVGRWMGVPEEGLSELMIAGLLHDIGKYRVPEKILNKKGKLTAEELCVMRKHVNYGYDLLKQNNDIHERVRMGVLSHHERNDGSGYPRQLKDNEIHPYGKILAVVDVYDAMISERVYKKRETPFEVMEHMLTEEIERLDPQILLVFIQNIAKYYIGVDVRLNTGEEATVVFLPPHCVYRPIVKVNEKYIDLSREKYIHITDII